MRNETSSKDHRILDGREIREVILQVVEESSALGPNFQERSVLMEIGRRLRVRNNLEVEQAILSYWHDLFRQGQLAYGYNLANPSRPFLHLTEVGRRTLRNAGRDPANPDGYLSHLSSQAELNETCRCYITEAVRAYGAGLSTAALVLASLAAESLLLEMRDGFVEGMKAQSRKVPSRLGDGRPRLIERALHSELERAKSTMPRALRDSYERYWPALQQQIRAARTDEGHPMDVGAVSPQTAQAALLVFPELAKLARALTRWLGESRRTDVKGDAA